MSNELAVIPEFEFFKFTPAVVEFNHEQILAALQAEMDNYKNVVISIESLADDKKRSQEFGRMIKLLNRVRIDKKNELLEPVKAFEEKVKELEQAILSVKDTWDAQIKTFEDDKLDSINHRLRSYVKSECDKAGLKDELRVGFDELVNGQTKLTAVTKAGSFSAQVKTAVAEWLAANLSVQNTAELRVARLEAECYRLGLSTPLQEAHIAHIVYLDEEPYRQGLERIINAELQRLEMQRLAEQRKAEAEQAKAEQVAEVIQPEANDQEAVQAKLDAMKQQAQPEQTKQYLNLGRAVVVAYFEIDVSDKVPNEAIEAKFLDGFARAGFKSLKAIEITRS